LRNKTRRESKPGSYHTAEYIHAVCEAHSRVEASSSSAKKFRKRNELINNNQEQTIVSIDAKGRV
jgi:hypothetical protein